MAITVGGTSITFNDGTTQTTAAGGAPTTAQVLSATAGAAVGDVGTYAWLWSTSQTATNAGGTKAGSNLRYAGFNMSSTSGTTTQGSAANTVGNGGTPAGTWRAMGRDYSYPAYGPIFYGMTLFLRIS